jgi:hypothetical protein
VPLHRIEEMLADLHAHQGVSTGKFKAYIKNRGICLGNCKEYGSQAALRAVLAACTGSKRCTLLVRKGDAKEYKHVKMCLVNVFR